MEDNHRVSWCLRCRPDLLERALAQQAGIEAYSAFLEEVYTLPTEEAIARVYEYIDPLLSEKPSLVDGLLTELDPTKLGAEVSVAVLIVTLGLKSKLSNRLKFIERARAVFDQEDEGADPILHGLT